MVVDFVEIKKELQLRFEQSLHRKIKQKTPFINKMAKKTVYHEGPSSSFKNITSAFSLKSDELRKLKFFDIEVKAEEIAEDMAKQMEKFVLEVVDESAKNVNNLVENKSIPETILEAVEKMQIEFYGSRNKKIPISFIVTPSMEKKFKQCFEDMSEEEKKDFDQKLEAIYDQKYKEYLFRKSNRKLVD